MSTHIKAKKRFVQVVIALVVICMTAAGGGYLMGDLFVKDAQAAYTADVSTATQWQTAVTNLQSGDIIINLSGDLNAGAKLTAIPANRHVTVNMNGHTIYWDRQDHGTGSTIMSTSYTSGDYADGRYWGLITVNSGSSLTLTGRGEVRIKQITTNMKDNSGRSDYVQRLAAIVNRGTVNIGSQVTVSGYCSNVDQGDNYKDAFIYCMGIYNDGGTVNTSGTINSGSMVASYSGGTNSYHYAICYGIYGGTVNANGGTINVDAYSGGYSASLTCGENNHMVEIAVGIYSNTAKVLGNTNINCNTITWQGQQDRDNWGGGGFNIMVSTGVMYLKGTNNYPVLGPGVNITSTYNMHNNERILPPGSTNDAQAYTNLHCADEGPHNWGRYAQAVTGVPWNEYTNGQASEEHTFEHSVNGTRRGFFGNIVPEDKSGNYLYRFDGWESYYRTEESYEKYRTNTTKGATNYLVDASSCNREATGRKQVETHDSYFQNGTPGNQGGGQFVTVYRFYNNNVSPANLYDVKFDMDNEILSNRGYAKTSDNAGANNYGGYIANNSINVTWGGGGNVRNINCYEYHNTTVEIPKTSVYAVRSKDQSSSDYRMTEWSSNGNEISNTVGTTLGASDNTMIIYINYIKKEPTAARVAVADKGTLMNKYTDSLAFTVEYTGATLVPGQDFEIEVLDMGLDLNPSGNNKEDDTDVTDQYNIKSESLGSGIAVTYRYTENYNDANPNWVNGLPKNAGKYTIEIDVASDTTYSSTCKNRLGIKQIVDCTISKAKAEVSGETVIRKTYGDTLAEMIHFTDYTVKGKGADVLRGTWAFDSHSSDEHLGANDGGYSITLKWTPSAGTESAKNYDVTDYPVTLYVDKREVTVNMGTSYIGFGDEPDKLSWELEYENLADCDNEKTAGWDRTTTGQIQVGGQWTDYTAETPKATYPAKIVTFGGNDDPNNKFTLNTKEGSLVVDKRALHYTAVAENRAYIPGNTQVNVTLTYVGGATDADANNINRQISLTGTTANPNAGRNKTVTVDMAALIDSQTGLDMNNYRAVLDNTCTVTITKADPEGVVCVAEPETIIYDSTRTLESVTLKATQTEVAGSWSWDNVEIIPSCDVNAYTAVFTPTDGNNYNTKTQSVTLNVEQKEIIISIPEQNIYYGDVAPNVQGLIKYEGWTGTDSLNNVKTEGNVTTQILSASGSPYNRGNAAGDYNIVINSSLTSTNYKFTAQNSVMHVLKRALTITVKDRTITYYDETPTFTPENDVVGNGFYTNAQRLDVLQGTPVISTTYRQGDKAGDYDITISGYESNNYDITFESGTLHVQKATLTVNPNNLIVGYGSFVPDYLGEGDDAVKQYVIEGFKGSDTEQTVEITGKPHFFVRNYNSGSKIGTYTVSVDTSDMSAENYVFVGDENSTLTVTKADPKIVEAPSASIVHSQLYSEAVFTNDAVVQNPNNDTLIVEGTFALKDAETRAEYTGALITVTAVFTPTGEDSDNYNTVEVTVFLDIREKSITGKPVIKGSAMVGEALTATVADTMDPNSDLYYDFQWYSDGLLISGATSSVYNVLESDKDHSLSVKVTAKEGTGYIGEAESESTSVIIEYLTPAGLEQLDYTIPENYVYNLDAHEATVKVKDGFEGKVGEITIRYNGSSTAPSAAGTYTVTVAIGVPNLQDGTEGKYGPVSGLVLGSYTIEKKEVKANVVPENKVYDGKRAATAKVELEGIIDDPTEVALAEGYVVRFDSAEVGSRTATATGLALTGAKASNYKVTAVPGTAEITKRNLTAIATGVTRAYNGSASVDIDFSNISGYADVDNSTTVYFINGKGQSESANAGTHRVLNDSVSEITFTLEGSSANNYNPVIQNADSVMVQIIPATPELTIPVIDAGAYNSARPLQSLDLAQFDVDEPGGLKGHWHFKEPDTIPTVSVTRYAATFHSSNSNYSNVDAEIIVNVTPALVTIKADDMTITYGSAIPTFTATITGLTGNDRIEDIPGIGYSFEHTYYPGASIGAYTITVRSSFDDDNYEFVSESGTLNVTAANLVVTATAHNKDYDGTQDIQVDFAITEGLYQNDNVALSVTSTTGTAATPNAGITTVTYEAPTLMGESSGNYVLVVTPASGVLEVEIYKISAGNVVFPTEGKVEFGYDLTHATFEFPGEGDGTFEYENAKNTVPGEIGVYSNYWVVFTPTDSRNYESQRQLVTLTVVKCKLDYVVGIAGTAQEGEVLTVAITGMPNRANDYIKYQWYRINDRGEYELIEDAVETSYTVLASDVGYTIYVVTYFEETAPYEYADTAAVDTIDNEIIGIIGSTIDAIQAIKLIFWQRLLNWIYRIIAAITGIRIGVTK